MTTMRVFLVVALSTIMLVAGCGQSSAERLGGYKTTLDTVKATSASIDEQTAQMAAALATAKGLLADANLPAEQAETVSQTAQTLQSKLSEIAAYKQTVDQQIATLSALVDQAAAGGEISDELKLYADGIGAAAPYLGKYGAYAVLAQLLLNIVAGIIAAKKAKESTVATAKYQAHKTGVEGAIRDLAAGNAETAKASAAFASLVYNKIGQARANAGIV